MHTKGRIRSKKSVAVVSDNSVGINVIYAA